MAASCSNSEDKYISLDCSFEGYKEEVILNKKTMTWDAFSLYLASAQEGEKMKKVISDAKYREEGEHQYYLMTPPKCPDCDFFLDRRTLTLISPHGGDTIQCKKIDLPHYLRENQI